MSHRVLSHAEFASQGGGSRRFADQSEGPSEGYYVSRHRNEGGETVVHGPATAVDVAHHFSRQHEQALSSSPDPNEVYQGLWSNGGKSYLDVSDRVGSFREAVRTGPRNQQEAAYDAKRGASVFLDAEGSDTHDLRPQASRPVRAKSYYKVTSKGYE